MNKEQVVVERAKLPKKASALSIIYTLLGLLIGFIAIPGEANLFVICCCLVYPLLGILIMGFSMGTIKFLSQVSRGQSPGIMMGFIFPAFIMLFHSLFYYNLVQYTALVIPTGIAIVSLTLLLYFSGINLKAEKPLLQAIIIVICSTIYAIGSIIAINCKFDDSPPMKFNTVVEAKNISESRGKKHYNLKLTPWERGQQTKQIEVTQTEYEQTPVDGPVGGHIKSGYLHIRWFYLDL